MKITSIQALNNNYVWMIRKGNHTVCIDPSDATPVLKLLIHNHLMLAQIWITHPHHGHIGGAKVLHNGFLKFPIYGESDIDVAIHTVTADTRFLFGEGLVTAWTIPGHTGRHISYLLESSDGLYVLRGDTLFSVGHGRVFTDTIEQLYDGFHQFNQLPEGTLFYPAHEYTASNLRLAQHIEPDNADTQTTLVAAEHTPTPPVSLTHERKVNPFFHVYLPQVRVHAKELSGRKLNSRLKVFAVLHELKNQFRLGLVPKE